jgi:hypothetical protein
LGGIIRSAIWSLNKSARRAGLVDPAPKLDREEVPDLGNDYPGPSLSPAESAIRSECQREQRRMLKTFEESISDDDELPKLLNAFKDGHYTPRDVEDLTGIPSARISELKRKLRGRMEKFEAQSREETP